MNTSTATKKELKIKLKDGGAVVKLPSGGRVRGVAIEGMRGRSLRLTHVTIADIMRHFPIPEADAAAWLEKVRLQVVRGMPKQYAIHRQDNGHLFAYLWPAPIARLTLLVEYADEEEPVVDQGARA